MNPYEAYGAAEGDRIVSRDYERDDRRDTYRRRTPTDDRRRPSRARSRSPGPDRYEPRDRPPRDDYYARQPPRERRPPSPGPINIDRYIPGEPEKPIVRTNMVINPLSMDTQAGFSYFAEWWRNEQMVKEDKERAKNGGRRPSGLRGVEESRADREKERQKIQEAYDQYKQDFQVKAARLFVQQHKGEEWFKERYVPEVRDPIRSRLTDFRRGALETWRDDMESGIFDDFTLEGIYKQDSDGAGGMVEKEEGEAVGGNEMLGVQDLVPAKGGELRDEAMNGPALLIKTLAPNVSRTAVEDFCKENLGTDEGGFRWLSLSDPNPVKKCHRIGWIMLNPANDDEAMEDVERGEGREEGESGEEKKLESVGQKALEAINGKTIIDPIRGDFNLHVGVHNAPNVPRKKALWDLFSAPERVEKDYQLARRLVSKLESEMGLDESYSGLTLIDARVDDMQQKGLIVATKTPKKPTVFESNADEIKFDVDGDEEAEMGDNVVDPDEEDDEELLVIKKKLDLMVEYLRRVFNFCLFCVFESDSVHELTRKCPGGHLRRPRGVLTRLAKRAALASVEGKPFPRSSAAKEDDGEDNKDDDKQQRRGPSRGNKAEQQLVKAFNWVKTFEDKLLQLLEPDHIDIKKIGGKPVEEAIEDELQKYVKQEDEGKFRCKVPECTKLFKAESFWRKHVEKRHEEFLAGLKSDLELVNTYVLDPSHIAPSRSDANSNGHFPLPPSYALNNGTPRGFNVANMMSFQNNFNNAMANGQGFVPGANGDSNGHAGGPVRRGRGAGFNNNRAPYDRRNGNFGNRGMQGGRQSAFAAQGGGGSGGKWGDGAGQPMNVIGPVQAVQGRTMRSYEDLDAMPTGGNNGVGAGQNGKAEELDY